jgi:hypothetical protein
MFKSWPRAVVEFSRRLPNLSSGYSRVSEDLHKRSVC